MGNIQNLSPQQRVRCYKHIIDRIINSGSVSRFICLELDLYMLEAHNVHLSFDEKTCRKLFPEFYLFDPQHSISLWFSHTYDDFDGKYVHPNLIRIFVMQMCIEMAKSPKNILK